MGRPGCRRGSALAWAQRGRWRLWRRADGRARTRHWKNSGWDGSGEATRPELGHVKDPQTPKSSPCPDIAFLLHPEPGLAVVGGESPAGSPWPLEPIVPALAPNLPTLDPRLLGLPQAQRTQGLSPGSEGYGQDAGPLALPRAVVKTLPKRPHQPSGATLSWGGKGQRGLRLAALRGWVLSWLQRTVSTAWAIRAAGGAPPSETEGTLTVPSHRHHSGLASAFRSECTPRAGAADVGHKGPREQGQWVGAQCLCVCQVLSSHPRGALLSTRCWALAPPQLGVSLRPLYGGSEALAPSCWKAVGLVGTPPAPPDQLPPGSSAC